MSSILFNQISSLDLRQSGQDVRVAVIEAPKLVTAPVSPKRSVVILVTMLGGLGVAFGLVTAVGCAGRPLPLDRGNAGPAGAALADDAAADEGRGKGRADGAGDARLAYLDGQRKFPNAANRSDADAPRRPPPRRDQRRAGRRQDDHAGQPGRLLCPGRQADAVDRRRSAAPRVDQLDEYARAARPKRGSPLRGRAVADGAPAHPTFRRRGAGHPPFRRQAKRSGGVARQSAVLATAGLGRIGLRPGPCRQPSNSGHHRHGGHRPDWSTASSSSCSRRKTTAGW